MRLLLTILAVLGLTTAAFAQMAPVRGPIVAPNQSSNGFHGITVSGSATKSIPATRARVLITLFARTPVINTKTVQPMVDALVKTGVPSDHIAIPPDLGSTASVQNTTIIVTVEHPTVELMQAGVAAVGAAVLGNTNGISVGNAQVTLEADGCGDTVDVTRAAAIKAARAKAEQTAKDLQVHVGEVLNVQANDQLSASGSCTTQYFVGSGNSPNLATPQDYVSVPVTVYATLTYAIKN